MSTAPGPGFREVRRIGRRHVAPVIDPPAAGSQGRPRVYLAPLDSAVDMRVLIESLHAAGMPPPRWVASPTARAGEQALRHRLLEGEPFLVPLWPPARGPDRLARLLAWAQDAGADIDLIPLEVLWGPTENRPQIRKLILGNPFDPPEWLRWLHLRRRGHCRVIVGAPGRAQELGAELGTRSDTLALAAHVRTQAVKALSKRERAVLGDRFKLPRLLPEQILAGSGFQDRVAAAGAEQGLTRDESLARAEGALRELATGHRRLAMELFARFCGWAFRQAYAADVDVDARRLGRLRELARHSPLVFVPSHQSNLDHLVLYHTLFTSGFPPPFTAAGINLSFWPLSRILPGTGAFFLRRAAADDRVYREALRGFISYLVQRRFHIEFFIEGGRTRTGKLLPPRFGVLRYIFESAREHRMDDVLIVPTSLTYEQVLEVGEYVRQQLGADKERESVRFLVRQIARARRSKLGRAYLRFDAPISLREYLDERGDDRLALEKLSFRVCTRINAARPLVAVSALCSTLLGSERRALTAAELETQMERLREYAEERDIGIAGELASGARAGLDAGLEALCRSDIARAYREGHESVYWVPDERRHAASYYRNSAVHFFLDRAIALLAERAAGPDAPDKRIEWALRLRELLKFEFFFEERQTFERTIEREHAAIEREREHGLPALAAASPRVLGDFLESYWIVTDALASPGSAGGALRRDELLRRCHAIGRQRLLQQHVSRPELLSSVTFGNALRLLENLEAGTRTPDGFVCGSADRLSALAHDLGHLTRLTRG